eukprot:5208100-Pleurochrysis_carterae.AAC.3
MHDVAVCIVWVRKVFRCAVACAVRKADSEKASIKAQRRHSLSSHLCARLKARLSRTFFSACEHLLSTVSIAASTPTHVATQKYTELRLRDGGDGGVDARCELGAHDCRGPDVGGRAGGALERLWRHVADSTRGTTRRDRGVDLRGSLKRTQGGNGEAFGWEGAKMGDRAWN